jgi:hypothetical protein
MKTNNSETVKMEKLTIIARWPRLLSIEQAAEYLSIAPKTIRNGLCRDVDKPFPVKPKRYGKRVLFDIKDLDKYVDSIPH